MHRKCNTGGPDTTWDENLGRTISAGLLLHAKVVLHQNTSLAPVIRVQQQMSVNTAKAENRYDYIDEVLKNVTALLRCARTGASFPKS